jgi:site-specific DNA-methyltransferase (adenine-specific)
MKIELHPSEIPLDLLKYFRPKRKYGPWILRNNLVWEKPNCMPSSVKDRFTVNFEMVLFFVANKKYFFETQYEPLAESSFKDKRKDKGLVPHKSGKSLKQDLTGNPTYTGFNERWAKSKYAISGTCINSRGRNKRAVWRVTTKGFKGAHFATYPESLIEPMISAGCPNEGIVMDPFFGAGTTGLVALKQNKKFVGIELNKEYIEIANNRLKPYLEQDKLTNKIEVISSENKKDVITSL